MGWEMIRKIIYRDKRLNIFLQQKILLERFISVYINIVFTLTPMRLFLFIAKFCKNLCNLIL